MMMDQRKEITRDPRYQVDTDGNVYGQKGQKLKAFKPVGGRYLQVGVGIERNQKCYVHQLVAEAFVPNPQGLPEVVHRDHDRLNNAASNLRWAREDEVDKTPNLARGERHRCVTLTDRQASEIRRQREAGTRPVELAEKYSVTSQAIRGALKRAGYDDGRRHGNAKLTDQQVQHIIQERKSGRRVTELAAAYGVSSRTIYCASKRPIAAAAATAESLRG